MKPPIESPEELLTRVQQYIRQLSEQGGTIEVPFRLQYNSDNSNSWRMSSSGKCARALVYARYIPLAETPSSQFTSLLLLGHVIHDLERALIRAVAPLYDEEKEVYLDIKGHIIPGHIDGLVESVRGPVLIDIKTSNDRSFEDMLNNGPKAEYIAQLHAYMQALKVQEAFLWLYNKNTSARAVLTVPYQETEARRVQERWQKVLQSTLDQLPEREYHPQAEIRKGQPTGRYYLPYQCTYCAYTERCQPEFKADYSSGKLRYIKEEECSQ